ncbi:MAG: hypothetical protein ACRENE_24910 [Polyangiaceae bacterium]
MRAKMLCTIALALAVSALVAVPSSAKPGDPGSHAEDNGDHGKHDHDKHDQDKGHDDDHRDARVHDDHDRDGKAKEGDDDEKSAGERREFRRGLFERREKDIVDRLNHDRTVVSDEVKESIRVHWRHLARLVRIRELALAAKEDTLAKHVDQVIDREDKAFTARLDKLREKASAADGGAR